MGVLEELDGRDVSSLSDPVWQFAVQSLSEGYREKIGLPILQAGMTETGPLAAIAHVKS